MRGLASSVYWLTMAGAIAGNAWGGELVGSEAERELKYPNIVPPRVVIGGNGNAPAQFLSIKDVAFRGNDSFFVADCGTDRIQEFALDGHLAGIIAHVDCPTNIAVAHGLLVALGGRNNLISVIDPDKRTVTASWPAPAGQMRAVGVWGDTVFVLPKRGGKIYAYTARGALVRTIDVPPLESAVDMAVGEDGFVIVDKTAAQIVALDRAGQEVARFGSYGTFPGEVANPHGVAATRASVIVADTVNHRIQEFERGGAFKLQWGRHPISPLQMSLGRMHYPHNVAASDDGTSIVVCEPYESKCNVFAKSDIVRSYRASDDSAYWNKFFWFHYRGPVKGTAREFFRIPVPNDLLFMGEEDIHRIVIAKVVDGVPETIGYFGEYGSEPGQLKGPEGVFAGPNGSLYVVDTGNNRVQVFDLDGNYKSLFGTYGSGPGELNEPGQGSADSRGRLYISDSGNQRVQVFDENGAFLFNFGEAGSGPGQLNRPIDARVDEKNKRVFVVDLNNAKVVVFDLDGKFLWEFGGSGTDIGQFIAPHSVDYDEATDSIFVTDMIANNVQKFSSSGRFLGRYGRYGTGLGEFKTPAGIAALGGRLYVMDHTNHRGQILNPENGTTMVSFGESIIGIPTDMLEARKRVAELELELQKLTQSNKPLPVDQLKTLGQQIQELKKQMDTPSILQQGHH